MSSEYYDEKEEPPPGTWRYSARITSEDDNAFFFTSDFINDLLFGLKIMMVGDSLTRGIYKDLVAWLQSDKLLNDRFLRARNEYTHMGDRQVDIIPLEQDRIFQQAREYHHRGNTLLQYVFTTRVMKEDMEKTLLQMQTDGFPDVICMNSCLWDLTRYEYINENEQFCSDHIDIQQEQAIVTNFLNRLSMLLRRLKVLLPPSAMFIWLCMPHTVPATKGFMTRSGAKERNDSIRSIVIDGNCRAAQLVKQAGYNVLDIGFYMRNHAMTPYRVGDGIHWNAVGTRLMTQQLLSFLAKAWRINFPPEITERIEKARKVDTDLQQSAQRCMTGNGLLDFAPNYAEKQDAITLKLFDILKTKQGPISAKAIEDTVKYGRTLKLLVNKNFLERKDNAVRLLADADVMRKSLLSNHNGTPFVVTKKNTQQKSPKEKEK